MSRTHIVSRPWSRYLMSRLHFPFLAATYNSFQPGSDPQSGSCSEQVNKYSTCAAENNDSTSSIRSGTFIATHANNIRIDLTPSRLVVDNTGCLKSTALNRPTTVFPPLRFRLQNSQTAGARGLKSTALNRPAVSPIPRFHPHVLENAETRCLGSAALSRTAVFSIPRFHLHMSQTAETKPPKSTAPNCPTAFPVHRLHLPILPTAVTICVKISAPYSQHIVSNPWPPLRILLLRRDIRLCPTPYPRRRGLGLLQTNSKQRRRRLRHSSATHTLLVSTASLQATITTYPDGIITLLTSTTFSVPTTTSTAPTVIGPV
jgi:hypothetical protein